MKFDPIIAGRIMDAFTRPHDQVTAIDELIQLVVALPIVLVVVVIIGILYIKLLP